MHRIVLWSFGLFTALLVTWVVLIMLPFLGVAWIPPAGPLPCPRTPLLEKATDGEGFKASLKHADLVRRLEAAGSAKIGPHPTRAQFRAAMKAGGLKCKAEQAFPGDERFKVAPTAQVLCEQTVPHGCPSLLGHWGLPMFVPMVGATAIFDLGADRARWVQYWTTPASTS